MAMGLQIKRAAALAALALAVAATAQPAGKNYEQAVLAIQQQIQGGNLEQARTLVLAAEKTYPADGGLENLHGVIAVQQGKTDEARTEFAAAVRHSPKLVSAYLNLGRIYMENAGHAADANVKALSVYERALAIAPDTGEAHYYAALVLMRTGKYAQSKQHLAKLPAEDRQRIGTLLIECADEAGLGHTAETDRDAAALAAQADLAESDVQETLPALLAARRADLAETLLTAAASHQPLSPAGLRTLGLAQEAEGKLPAARETLERAFAADSKSKTILVDLARVAEAAKDYTGALGYVAHARDLDPKDASLAYLFGSICVKMSLLSEARKALAEALALEPENPGYNYAMGMVVTFAENPNAALPYFEKFHKLRPDDASGILALGTTYFRAKEYESAGPWLKQAAEKQATTATALYYMARIARQEGHAEDALAELNHAAELDRDRPDILAELGQTYLQMKRFPEAEKQLDRAAALEPENYAANFGLLQLYARTADPRREEQSKRFEAIKQKNEEQLRDSMRAIEIRPQGEPAK
jgi:tetratricopeptide (TPR) repeat protein